MVEEEGLAARQSRHERNHRALAAGIEAMGSHCFHLRTSACGRSTR